MDRIQEFWKKHYILIIGIALYILMYILSNCFPAWMSYEKPLDDRKWVINARREMASGGFLHAYVRDVLPENRFTKLIPLNFFYYGLEDIAAGVHYGVFLPIALVSWCSFFLELGLNALCGDKVGKAERFVISHLYENAMFYPLSFVMIFLNRSLEKLENSLTGKIFDDVPIAVQSLFVVLFVLTILIVIVVFGLPMMVNWFYFFAYLIGLSLPYKLINTVQQGIGDALGQNSVLTDLLLFLIAVAALIVFNLLSEWLLEFFQKLSLKPTLFLISKLKRNKG